MTILVLQWRPAPRHLDLRWRGGGIDTSAVPQPQSLPSLAAIVGPPGPAGTAEITTDLLAQYLLARS